MRHMQNRPDGLLTLDYEVTLEKKLNGERADLVAEKAGERIAIEIETGNSNASGNIKKCLDGDFSLVVLVPIERQIEDEIKKRLSKENLNESQKVSVITSEQFE